MRKDNLDGAVELGLCVSKFNKRVLRSELNEMFSRVWTAEYGLGPRD